MVVIKRAYADTAFFTEIYAIRTMVPVCKLGSQRNIRPAKVFAVRI
jgi:hypothetical protein